jgi:endonuclease III
MSEVRDDRLFQEDLRSEFWMLVACVLANVTRWTQAQPVLLGIRARLPTAAEFAAADVSEVEQVVCSLGLGRQRSGKLVNLAASWSHGQPQSRDNVFALPGCGPYAADSWEIFVLGKREVAVKDRALLSYLAATRDREEVAGSTSSGALACRIPPRNERLPEGQAR